MIIYVRKVIMMYLSLFVYLVSTKGGLHTESIASRLSLACHDEYGSITGVETGSPCPCNPF